jgi:class 3 adenylate cyclase
MMHRDKEVLGMAKGPPCPQCGHENDTGQSFCGYCGNKLVLTCDACGATAPVGFRFCGSCGAQLQLLSNDRPSGEERRVVSVIFVDLVGFTSRAERLDPEDVRAMLTPYYASLRQQIEAFGGRVEKFIGDAVMGLFGAPVAHGDDPERAVRVALRILEEVGRMNAAEPGRDLEVRIGVNTGEAIVGPNALTDEGLGMVAGDVVNTAARLQAAAPASSILVGEETYRCTCFTIDYEPVDPLTPKGKELPVAAWRALEASRPPGERVASDIPMVGREHELATLTGAWRRVVEERQPHLVTIFGVSGVGKSRLAAEFVKAVRETGARVVLGRSLPYGESGAYGAFAQQVKQVAGVFDGDPPAALVEKLRWALEELVGRKSADEVAAHIAMLLGLPTQEWSPTEEVYDRHALFFSARRFVEALGSAQPTILVFQDLHWADSSLLDLIEQLSARVEKAPLLLLALSRPELQASRPRWGAGIQASVALPLEPLDEESSRELAARLLARGSADRAAEMAAEICSVAEGNPLFIEELAASVAEQHSRADELPTSIRGIIAARLDAVPAPERAVLLDAAVVGRIFWDGALAQLGRHNGELPELLDSLEGRDLIRREAGSRFRGQQQYRFKHALIREVAYATLPRAKRREAHAAVAAFLEEMHGEHESPAALGQHWLEAGDRARAANYFAGAAEQASRGWAKDEAVAFYKQALELVTEEDEERRRELRRKLAVAHMMVCHLPFVERTAAARGRAAT